MVPGRAANSNGKFRSKHVLEVGLFIERNVSVNPKEFFGVREPSSRL